MTNRFDRRDFLRAGVAVLGAATAVEALTGPAPAASHSTTAVVYFNGSILTMEGEFPEYVEAIAVRDGMIVSVGTRQKLLAAFANAQHVDLAGRTLMPGFIDSWGHFTLFAQQTLGVNIAYFSDKPPHSKADVLALLKAAQPFNGWLIGYGYDAALLSDGALTLEDLDAAFPDTPVMISTLSTLTGQVNSAGIAKLGLTVDTKASQPGQIVKDPSTGKLTGALLFTPFLEAHAQAVGSYSQDQALKTFKLAEQLLAAQGYTTVQSYQLQPSEIANIRAAFDRQLLNLDIIGMPSISDASSGKIVEDADWIWGAYSHGDYGLKIPGFQVATDAAPQLRLAAFTEPYLDTTGFPKDWKGMLLPGEMVDHWVEYAYEHDIQLFAYSNGDAGIDLSLSAIEKAIAATGKSGDRRTVIAHSYFARPDQLEDYRKLNIGASMMPPHLMLYGDLQMKLLGPARATKESPLASAERLGLNTTIHCDCPSASPNMMEAIWTAVTRTTLSGAVLGPEERISPYHALLGATRNGAYAYREEATKGTISAGKIADLIILDANPLTVHPDQIRNIRVIETIKRGKSIFSRD